MTLEERVVRLERAILILATNAGNPHSAGNKVVELLTGKEMNDRSPHVAAGTVRDFLEEQEKIDSTETN